MANAGMAIMLFGVFIFYSFLGWGIAELYNEPQNPITNDQFTEFINVGTAEQSGNHSDPNYNDPDCYSQDCTGYIDYLPGGSNDPFTNFGKWIWNIKQGFGYSFQVLTYSNKHIPPLVNLFIITPLNFLVFAAGILIVRGIGS